MLRTKNTAHLEKESLEIFVSHTILATVEYCAWLGTASRAPILVLEEAHNSLTIHLKKKESKGIALSLMLKDYICSIY